MLHVFLFCFSFCGFSQMDKITLSSQGGVYTTVSQISVSQSIGQPSVIGSGSSSNATIYQGFQHKRWASIISANKHPFDLSVFPNPFKEEVTLTFERASDAPAEVSLYTISGVLMYKGVFYQQDFEIAIRFPNIPVATYMLQVTQNEHTNYQQLIKI